MGAVKARLAAAGVVALAAGAVTAAPGPAALADGNAPRRGTAPESRAAVVKLDPVTYDAGTMKPELAKRVAQVQAAAKAEHIPLTVTSGYRSTAEQSKLFKEAVAQYGTEAEASKWVLPSWASHHVQGIAVDLGPNDTTRAWVEKRQEEFGLCRRYGNETWHFELNVWGTCPAVIPTSADEL